MNSWRTESSQPQKVPTVSRRKPVNSNLYRNRVITPIHVAPAERGGLKMKKPEKRPVFLIIFISCREWFNELDSNTWLNW